MYNSTCTFTFLSIVVYERRTQYMRMYMYIVLCEYFFVYMANMKSYHCDATTFFKNRICSLLYS